MERTSTTTRSRLDRVRELTHRGVDTVFDGAETVAWLAPSLAPHRLTSAALRGGRSVAGRVLSYGERGTTSREPIRSVPAGPEVVSPAEPGDPAADGAAAARAEHSRPRPAVRPARSSRPRTPEVPDELVHSSGSDS